MTPTYKHDMHIKCVHKYFSNLPTNAINTKKLTAVACMRYLCINAIFKFILYLSWCWLSQKITYVLIKMTFFPFFTIYVMTIE